MFILRALIGIPVALALSVIAQPGGGAPGVAPSAIFESVGRVALFELARVKAELAASHTQQETNGT